MSKKQKDWARRKLAELRVALGEACVKCGSTEKLEFDCIEPQGHKHHKGSTDQRASFYRLQFSIGNLQLLCDKCHGEKSRKEHRESTENKPF